MGRAFSDGSKLETNEGGQSSSPSLVVLDARDPRHVAAAAHLHALVLAESFIPQLGDRFMRAFYYPKLGGSGLIKGTLCVHEGQYVGLSVLTTKPDDFLGIGMRRYFPSLAREMAWSILLRPSRLGIVWKVLSEKSGREQKRASRVVGEILTFGVVPAYRGRKLGERGQTVASRLVEDALDRFRGEGASRVQVVTSRDNLRAIAFYEAHGFAIEDPEYPGERCLLSMETQGGA